MNTVRVLNQHLRMGMRLWNQGRYWHCHEAWEKAWLKLRGRERAYLQGCIQAAAVQVLITKKRRQAAVRVASRALELLGSRMPSGASGLRLPKIPGIRKALRTFIRESEEP
jgi:hypothetical protein